MTGIRYRNGIIYFVSSRIITKNKNMKKIVCILAAAVFVFGATAVLAANNKGMGLSNDDLEAQGQSQANVTTKNTAHSVSASVSPNAVASVSPVANQVRTQAQISVQEHQSAVANFVQTLVKVADREKGGIGEQVRVVAQQQNQAVASTTAAMEKIQTRSKVKTFFIGTDYKNVGQLRSEMAQTQSRIEQLTRLTEQAKNAADKTTLQTQIQTMEQEQSKIETFLKANESKFSLFGWLVKLFNK